MSRHNRAGGMKRNCSPQRPCSYFGIMPLDSGLVWSGRAGGQQSVSTASSSSRQPRGLQLAQVCGKRAANREQDVWQSHPHSLAWSGCRSVCQCCQCWCCPARHHSHSLLARGHRHEHLCSTTTSATTSLPPPPPRPPSLAVSSVRMSSWQTGVQPSHARTTPFQGHLSTARRLYAALLVAEGSHQTALGLAEAPTAQAESSAARQLLHALARGGGRLGFSLGQAFFHLLRACRGGVSRVYSLSLEGPRTLALSGSSYLPLATLHPTTGRSRLKDTTDAAHASHILPCSALQTRILEPSNTSTRLNPNLRQPTYNLRPSTSIRDTPLLPLTSPRSTQTLSTYTVSTSWPASLQQSSSQTPSTTTPRLNLKLVTSRHRLPHCYL